MEPAASANRLSSSSGDQGVFSAAEVGEFFAMKPAASAYRLSSSSGDQGVFSAAEVDLEQQQRHVDMTATAVRRWLSKEDEDVDVKPPGILKQGRYTSSTPPSSSSNHPRRNKAFSAMFLIGTVAFIIGSVANVLNGGQLLPTLAMTADSRRLKSRQEVNEAAGEAFMTMLMAETTGLPEDQRQRMLAVGKSTWPRCVNEKLNVYQCKELIDQDILDLNTETDQFVRTIILKKRNENDELYNSIVIFMDDNNRVVGRDGDGKIYYDFKWKGSGKEASCYQRRQVPPIVATELEMEPTIDSIEVEIVPKRGLGACKYDAMDSTERISGGIETLGMETDTAEGAMKLQTALAETVTIEQAGARDIGPFDCSGMTGRSCCLMIKNKVRDSDTKGNAIQCYLDFHQETGKAKALLNSRGKKVFIFENHKGRISKEPKVVGGWPKGIAVDEPGFHDWIQDGGGLSDGQMRLIHGPDWQP